MTLKDKYPDLYTFLGAWFPDSDYEDKTDEEIVGKFISVVGNEKGSKVLEQGQSLIKHNENLLDAIGDISNRYFENKAEAKEWLNLLLDSLQSEMTG